MTSKRGIALIALVTLAISFERSILPVLDKKHRLSSSESVANKKNDDDYNLSISSAHFVPLFIGAGQGTTATHAIHDSMCELGISSVHYNLVCFRGAGHETNRTNMQHGIDAHFQARDSWMELTECVGQARKESKVCNKTMELIADIRQNVVKVIQSGIGAVHDAPYVLMVPFIIKVSKQVRGVEPIIILSERDPQEWAKRRVQKHKTTPQIVCKDPKGAFDIDYCLDSGVAVDNLFHAYTDNNDKKKQEEYISLLGESMARYQESIRQLLPDYRINLFESDEKTDVQTIAHSIWNNTKTKLTSDAVHELIFRQEVGGLAREKKAKLGPLKCMDASCRRKKNERIRHPHKQLYTSTLT